MYKCRNTYQINWRAILHRSRLKKTNKLFPRTITFTYLRYRSIRLETPLLHRFNCNYFLYYLYSHRSPYTNSIKFHSSTTCNKYRSSNYQSRILLSLPFLFHFSPPSPFQFIYIQLPKKITVVCFFFFVVM